MASTVLGATVLGASFGGAAFAVATFVSAILETGGFDPVGLKADALDAGTLDAETLEADPFEFTALALADFAFAGLTDVFAVLLGISLLLFLGGFREALTLADLAFEDFAFEDFALEDLVFETFATGRVSLTEARAWLLVAPRLAAGAILEPAVLEPLETLFLRVFCDTA